MPGEDKPKEQISMRHSKLTAAEASLLAGEMQKPSWQSKNEGIHERVSFEDSIWGFDLAGGSYYKTPLRVTAVKPDSRADKAGIMPGDMLLRINDIDTSTLTIQEAHEIIIESGIHLRIAVTCPDDDEDSYHCYEDVVEEGYDSEEERRKQSEKEKKREIHAKVSSYWSLQWPWVSKRRVIYRESNCFLVPSKYENQHREKFPIQPTGPKVPEDIVLHSTKDDADDALTADGVASTGDLKTSELVSNTEALQSVPSTEKLDDKSNIKENNVEIPINGTDKKITETNEVSKVNGNAESEANVDTENNLSMDDIDETFENSANPSTNDQLDTTEEILTDFEDMNESVKENGISDLSELEEASHEDELINEDLDETENSRKGDNTIDEILSNGGDNTISESLDNGR